MESETVNETLTFAESGFCVERVAGAAARGADAGVRPDGVVTALRVNAIVQIKQALVNI